MHHIDSLYVECEITKFFRQIKDLIILSLIHRYPLLTFYYNRVTREESKIRF